MSTPVLTVTPLKPNAPIATATDLHFLVTIAAPAATGPAPRRSELNLAVAIDASTSMQGQPIEQAKECARRIARALGEGDTISISSYSTEAKLVLPPRSATDISAILAAINSIHATGFTNLHAGWLTAAEAAAKNLRADILTRVMVLSDGNTNKGILDPAEITKQVEALASKGIVTSTIGLGEQFNEDLMAAIARAGQGSATYGETADDLWPSFEAELGLLSATFGKRVRVGLTSAKGTRVSVENGYTALPNHQWQVPTMGSQYRLWDGSP